MMIAVFLGEGVFIGETNALSYLGFHSGYSRVLEPYYVLKLFVYNRIRRFQFICHFLHFVIWAPFSLTSVPAFTENFSFVLSSFALDYISSSSRIEAGGRNPNPNPKKQELVVVKKWLCLGYGSWLVSQLTSENTYRFRVQPNHPPYN